MYIILGVLEKTCILSMDQWNKVLEKTLKKFAYHYLYCAMTSQTLSYN